jgi:predicted nuclease with TOPRIM domain
MSWLDLLLIGGIIGLIYWARQLPSLKEEEASPDNETLADELSRLDARVAKQRDRLRQLHNGRR